MQRGTPRQIYETPNSTFVADFVGAINFIDATVRETNAGAHSMVLESEIGVIETPNPEGFLVGESVQVCVRPENVHLSDEAPHLSHANHYLGVVHLKIFLGEVLDFQVKIGGKLMLARVHPHQKTPVDHPIYIHFDPSNCVVFER